MKILFSDEHVANHQMHGISRMMRCVLSGLKERGHTCIPLTNDVNDGNILLLSANGLVGVPNKQHKEILTCNLPIVSVIYDIIPYVFNKSKEKRYEEALRNTLDCSHSIITISHHSAKDLRQHLNYKDSITVIHPGVPFDPPPQNNIVPDDYFLSVGGYGERKGHAELLEAIIETDQPLIMVGVPFYYDPRTKDLAGKAINRGLLVELQDVPDDTLINLYQYAQALVYPTKYEGFGLPIIEAMSCGCPVITTGLTATIEAAGSAALFIEPTKKSIVWGMESVVGLRHNLIVKGLTHAATFNWQEIAVAYETVFASLI